MAIIPPSGNNLLPGKVIASNNIIGAKTLVTAQISARPAKKAPSKPMLIVLPFKGLLEKSVIPCDKDLTAGINHAPINENNL